MKSIRAKDSTIEEYFKFPELVIPPFQRDFVWREEEADDFWTDFVDNKNQFLGSFILKDDKYVEDSKTGWLEIVDGQQRTTSLIILFSIFAHNLKELGKEIEQADSVASEHASDIEELISYKDRKTRKIIGYKLRLPEAINSEFTEAIRTGGVEKASGALSKQFGFAFQKYNELVRDHLAGFSSSQDKITELVDLKLRLLDTKIILVRVSSDEEAYDIFEAVNARGAELGVADLLKNHLFSKVEDKQALDKRWSEIKKILTNIDRKGLDFTSFLRFYWIGVYEHLSKKALYRAIKNKLKLNITTPAKLMEEISGYADAIEKIFENSLDDWKGFFPDARREQLCAHEWFSYKRNLDYFEKSIQYLPIYTTLVGNLDKLKLKNRSFVSLLLAIEKMNFTYSYISQKQTNRIDKLLSSISRKINTAIQSKDSDQRDIEVKIEAAVTSSVVEIERFLHENISKQEVYEFVSSLSFKNKKDKRIIYFILTNLEYEEGGYGRMLVDDDLTLEHVYPKSVESKQKIKEWPPLDFDYQTLGHGLGNLTLLPESGPRGNSLAGEKGFIEKRKSYLSASPFSINQYFTHVDQWGGKEILDRLAYIQDRVWKRWGPNPRVISRS